MTAVRTCLSLSRYDSGVKSGWVCLMALRLRDIATTPAVSAGLDALVCAGAGFEAATVAFRVLNSWLLFVMVGFLAEPFVARQIDGGDLRI